MAMSADALLKQADQMVRLGEDPTPVFHRFLADKGEQRREREKGGEQRDVLRTQENARSFSAVLFICLCNSATTAIVIMLLEIGNNEKALLCIEKEEKKRRRRRKKEALTVVSSPSLSLFLSSSFLLPFLCTLIYAIVFLPLKYLYLFTLTAETVREIETEWGCHH
jgi:hypothetical protein